MKQVELMNKYVADLMVLNVKFHNLHWNVVGKNFENVHVYVEKLYDDLFLKFDEVAERIKMIGEFPKANVKTYLETSTVTELEDKDHTIQEVFETLLVELQFLKASAYDIRKEADDNDDFVTVALMEDHIGAFDKEIYFVKQALK